MKSTITLVDGIVERAHPLGFFERPRLECRSIRGSPRGLRWGMREIVGDETKGEKGGNYEG